MNLELSLIDGFEYSTKQKSFPFVIEVSSEEDVELAEKIDVLEMSLKNKKNEKVEFGVDRLILGTPGKSFLLKEGNVKKIEKNIFEKDDPEGFTPGEYSLKAVVVLYIKTHDNYISKELTVEKDVYVSS